MLREWSIACNRLLAVAVTSSNVENCFVINRGTILYSRKEYIKLGIIAVSFNVVPVDNYLSKSPYSTTVWFAIYFAASNLYNLYIRVLPNLLRKWVSSYK